MDHAVGDAVDFSCLSSHIDPRPGVDRRTEHWGQAAAAAIDALDGNLHDKVFPSKAGGFSVEDSEGDG